MKTGEIVHCHYKYRYKLQLLSQDINYLSIMIHDIQKPFKLKLHTENRYISFKLYMLLIYFLI